jgi:putative membrane protein
MLIPFIVSGVEVKNFFAALMTALVLSIINVIIKPILLLLALPVNLLTLGLFTLVINALLFWFVSTFVKGFEIAGFWPAFFAALIYSVFSIIFNHFIDKQPQER